MVGRAKPHHRYWIRGHVPDLVALTLLEVVALSAAGLEEVGALLGVTLNIVSVWCFCFNEPLVAARRQRRAEATETSSRIRILCRRQYRELRAVQDAASECCSFLVRLVWFPCR
jgi:hypothetical protein